ncbi:hypothetical protein PR048_025718 [Dryococelus australis]|uniref:Uncharacterized protein n=1 Tax=Dryococelus australis TaxID=614101 RepID=A0ABQ9GJC8_9NEOP|nr:hypothetical protein PR048_025718 [Dryococelus australis]
MRGRSGLVVRQLTSNLREPVSLSGGVAPCLCRTITLVGGFSRGSPPPSRHFHSGAAPYLPCFAHISSQDTEVKSRPDLLHALHQGDPGSIPGRVTPDYRVWESYQTIPLVGGFSRGSPVSPPFNSSAAPYSPQSPSSTLKTSILSSFDMLVFSLCKNLPTTLILGLIPASFVHDYFPNPRGSRRCSHPTKANRD